MSRAAVIIHDVKQPCRVGKGAGHLSVSPCDQWSAVPTPSALSIAPTAWARRPRPSAWRDHSLFCVRLCPPYKKSLSRFSSLYSLLSIRFFCCHPDEGMAERRQAPGCCEHPVVRAMTGTRAPCFRRPAFPAKGNARLSALHRGDFAARACARRCPAFPPGSRADLIRRGVIVTRRTRSRGPPAGICRSANLTLGQPQASLRISRRL